MRTMIVMFGNVLNAQLQVRVKILQNDLFSIQIQSTPDNVPDACDRNLPKGWMHTHSFEEWLCRKRLIKPLSDRRQRHLFKDNASIPEKTKAKNAAFAKSSTRLKFF